MRLTLYALIFCWISIGRLEAQNPIQHFSLFDFAPLTLNPAYTGAYEGTFRLGGIYRDQWSSFLPNQFTTPSFYVDAPVISVRKTDWLGAGVVLYSDRAGSGNLGTTGFMGSLAYHLALDKKSNSILTIGAQIGSVQRRIDQEGLRFRDELLGGTSSSPDRTRIEDKVSYTDIGAGILLRSKLNKTMSMDLGVSVVHLTSPDYNLITDLAGINDQNLPLGIIVHGRFNADLSDKWMFSPAFMFQTLSTANEMALQVWGGYHLNKEKQITVKAGTGYRLRDAAKILLGMDYRDLKVGLAYDVGLSNLNTGKGGNRGFEIAAGYIIKIYKQPEVDPVLLCPRL